MGVAQEEIARLYATLETRMGRYEAGMARAQRLFQGTASGLMARATALTTGLGARFASIATGLGAAVGLAGGGGALVALGAGMAKAVSGASSLGETLDKTQRIFGPAFDAVNAFAANLEAKFGVARNASLNAADAFAAFGKNVIGLEGGALAGFSNSLTQLAADFMSYHDLPFDEAAAKLRAGLSGETEPLKQFGVIMNEATVEAAAYRAGIARVGQELTEAQKVQARYLVIMRATNDWHGNLAATSGSFANRAKAAWGTLSATLTNFGTAILPALGRMLGGLVEGLNRANAWVQANTAAIAEWADYLQGRAAAAIGWLGAQLAAVGAWLQENVVAVLGYASAWDLVSDAGRFVVAVLQSAIERAAMVVGGFARMTAAAADWVSRMTTGLPVMEAIRAATEAIGVVWRNWNNIVAHTLVRVRGFFVNIGEAITWLGTQIGNFLGWFSVEWKNVFRDAYNAAVTVISNLAKNYKDLGVAIWNYIKSGFDSDAFNFQVTPLMQGFQSQIKSMPDFTAPVFSSVKDELAAIEEAMGRTEQQHTEQVQERADARAAAAKAAAAGAKAGEAAKRAPYAAPELMGGAPPKKEAKGGEFVGLADFARRIQSNALENKQMASIAASTGASAATLARLEAIQQKQLDQAKRAGAVLADA